MKKIFILLTLFSFLLLTGCGKNSIDDIFKNLTNKINNLTSYKVKGNLEVKNNKTNYTYQVEVSYQEKDKFKVSLINTSNNHEQVILRNDEGIFVLTPSLNKSFKFQSDWPYNNSQVYLLNSIIDDLNNDSNIKKEIVDNKYIFTSKVNYPNNSALTKQKVIVNKDLIIEKVEVLTDSDEVEMTFNISNIDYNPTFDETYFEVNSIINSNQSNQDTDTNSQDKTTDDNKNFQDKENNTKNDNKTNQSTTTQETATLDDIIYPLYLPTGTVLEEQEKVSKTDGERVILTFSGEKNFTLVEETVAKEKEFTVIPTYGEPQLVNDTIGAVTDNSLNWISDNVEYYLVSEVMSSTELLEIANSISTQAVMKQK